MLRSLSTTSAGLMRVHGPFTARCPGSGKPPRQPLARSPLNETQSLPLPSPRGFSPLISSSPSLATPALATIPNIRVLCHITRSARQLCSSKLAAILGDIVWCNSVASWNRLFLFAPRCLRQPRRGKHTESLSTIVKRQLQEEFSTTVTPQPGTRRTKQARKCPDPIFQLAHKVTTKIEEGDFRGAIRLASSNDPLADFSDDSFDALQSKHPPPHPDSHISTPPVANLTDDFEISEKDIVGAIRSFPCGSAGGPDKLCPQHLKDLLQPLRDNLESPLLSALVDFCYLVLRGDISEITRPLFFGASLVALSRKSGGVRPIAVG